MYRQFVVYKIVFFFTLIFSFTPMQCMAMPKSAATADGKTVTGTVIETMNSSGYTYILVDAEGAKNWVAIPETTVKAGSRISYYEGMIMPTFTSKTLNKSFENIVFSAGLAETADSTPGTSTAAAVSQDDSFSAALQAEQKSVVPDPTTALASGGSAVAIAPLQEITVPKALGENGYTVEEIFAGGKTLAGKKVRVQGKVIKFSANIMGKNWVHLQDGTGSPLQNSHDLVLTTDTTLSVDAIVTMEGILAADKDFGAGYKYTVIVEQASQVK
jgi:hypothetical protein